MGFSRKPQISLQFMGVFQWEQTQIRHDLRILVGWLNMFFFWGFTVLSIQCCCLVDSFPIFPSGDVGSSRFPRGESAGPRSDLSQLTPLSDSSSNLSLFLVINGD